MIYKNAHSAVINMILLCLFIQKPKLRSYATKTILNILAQPTH